MDDVRPPRPPAALAVIAVAIAALVLAPFWIWLVLAAWVGQLGRRMVPPLSRLSGGRQRAAAILTASLLAVLVVPLGLLAASLVDDGVALARRLLASSQARAVFEQLVTRGATDGQRGDPLELLVQHGDRAWSAVSMVLAVAAEFLLGLFVFLSGTYAVLADGPRAYAWLERHLPLDARITRRFAAAFTETGHGLLVGVGGAGLAQAVIATVAFAVLAVPEPLVLGVLTLVASVVPSVGTALVWGPVAIGLALTGRTDAAIAMTVVGVAVIGTVDNLVRPLLARWGKLDLPSFLIMVAMFGGIVWIGAAGVVLGPLALRLAKEALVIAREHREGGAGGAAGAGADGAGADGAGTESVRPTAIASR